MKPVHAARFGLGSSGLAALAAVALVASSAFADDGAPHKTNKAPAHPRHAKSVAKSASSSGPLEDVKFSNPYAPPVGAAQAPKSDLAPAGKAPPKQPEGGVSVGVKWHASNDPNNPYEHVLPRSGADEPGDSLQLGVKLGF